MQQISVVLHEELVIKNLYEREQGPFKLGENQVSMHGPAVLREEQVSRDLSYWVRSKRE